VEVCPTGIDIREGLQYECIGCAACIDGCNQIMGKMGYPPGLIRYTTENALDGHWSKAYMWRRLVRPRVLAYAAILIALVGGTIGSLVTRVPLQMDVMRDRKALSRAITVEGQSGWIENTYRLQIMNMDEEPHRYRISVSGLPGIALEDSPEILIDSTESRTLAINARIPPEQLEPGSHHIFLKIEAEDAPRIQRIEQAAFLLPL
jgi:polyferredoxin